METKNCQKCSKAFSIDESDVNFYQMVSVPHPTFCPECRLLRRFIHTSETVLYKRKCDFTGEEIFSMYPENTIFQGFIGSRDIY